MNEQKYKSLLKLQPSGCIEWQGGWINDGYGRLRLGKETILAHRLAFPQLTNKKLGEMFGVNNQSVSGICTRASWRHI